MNGNVLYPKYIRRDEEKLIQQAVDKVRGDKRSRAVLLYGPGGVGKTSLARQMAGNSDATTIWLEPIDVDDPECWLISNLERKVARQMDPDDSYFGPYKRQLLQLPEYMRAHISHETVVSYLGRVKEIFASCYRDYVEKEQKTVVIIFDTVETIRGTNLLLTLTQWIKALPLCTLFILSGRPYSGDLAQIPRRGQDPIEAELTSPYHGIPITHIDVGGFTFDGAKEFIRLNNISGDLIGDEEEKLIHLCRGHPLWLAFMIDYLRKPGIPEEVEQHSLDHIAENLPYGGDMTREGERLHEEFLRRLVAPYKDSDFWHEAIKRLAVVRQPIAKPVWQRLMADCLPDDTESSDAEWQRLLDTAWIRPRGNRRYVTLHDAVAEELAERLFPLHDASGSWRREIWLKTREIYQDLIATAEADLMPRLASLEDEFNRVDVSRPADDAGFGRLPDELVERAMALDIRRRELDQWKAASLYYLFLCDFEGGCRELLESFTQAEEEHDTFFQDLLVLYLERFLPGGAPLSAFNDVVRRKLDDFRRWLTEEKPAYYSTLGLMVTKHLIEAAQPEAALTMLDGIFESTADHRQLHRIHILRGDACMRISGRVKEALVHFERALTEAEAIDSTDRHKLIAEARKEQGFYYRSIGQWQDADLSYKHARDAMSASPASQRLAADRAEIASIHTQWAYVKGLTGYHRDGLELVLSAISVRNKMGLYADEGLSWSVRGEIYRYARRYKRAWESYERAEQLLQARRNWDRLGLVYQEQAVCLYQATREGLKLTDDPTEDSRRLITRALDICMAHGIRGYPSALNRAGRIFGRTDPEAGLDFLRKGISEAQKLSDGWFWYANLIEYAELCYRTWTKTGNDVYRVEIEGLADDVQRVSEDYSFPDLSGRWSLLNGHLAVVDYRRTGDKAALNRALESYQNGFANIARKQVGSSGTSAIRGEFTTFAEHFSQLPEHAKEEWQAKLRSAWSTLEDSSTLLLALLEELD